MFCWNICLIQFVNIGSNIALQGFQLVTEQEETWKKNKQKKKREKKSRDMKILNKIYNKTLL